MDLFWYISAHIIYCIYKSSKVAFTVKINLHANIFVMKSLKSPTVHNFPQKFRPLKPITVLFLQSVSLWVGNCFYNFITFKALAYLDSTDRILPLACSGRELMEKETIELPWRFHGERSSCTRIILKALYSVLIVLCGCCIVHFIYLYSEIGPNISAKWIASLLSS